MLTQRFGSMWPWEPGHFATRPSAGMRRAIAVNLSIFFLFALTALIFLSRSAVEANAINRDVGTAIKPATTGIEDSTGRLPKLNRTIRITSRIADSTDALAGHLDGVVASTARIDANLQATSSDVVTIGGSVENINATVSRIRPEIFTLNDTVDQVHNKANGIAEGYAAVASNTTAMTRSLAGINSSLAAVLADTGPLAVQVGGIRSELAATQVHTRDIANSPILLNGTLEGLLDHLLGGLLDRREVRNPRLDQSNILGRLP